jgi:adhesin transport system outer membrane protein
LFDVVAADNAYFGAAARYILAVTELDAARYVVLARTGRLIEALDIRVGNRAR